MYSESVQNEMISQFNLASITATKLGFESLIYDYTPVPLSLEGELITPSLLFMNQVPDDMQSLWSQSGYYQVDPVQRFALNTSAPFEWSYQSPEKTALKQITASSSVIQDYMNDHRISSGITIPIHLSGKGFATFTGIFSNDNEAQDMLMREQHKQRLMADLMLLGHRFHESIYSEFDDDIRRCHHVELSKRERECLAYSSDGLTAKEIAQRIHRSIPTVNMHLNSAMQKLGASNKVQAVVKALHYHLLD